MSEEVLENSNQVKNQTTQVVVFALDSEEYAVSILEVREVIKLAEITPVPQSQTFISGVINLRGKIVPVIDLEKKFHFTRETNLSPQHIVIAESTNGSLFGILVDKVVEVLKIDGEAIKPAPTLVKNKIAADFLKGVIVLGEEKEHNQRILLMIDLQMILTQEELKSVKQIVTETQPSQQVSL